MTQNILSNIYIKYICKNPSNRNQDMIKTWGFAQARTWFKSRNIAGSRV